MKEEIRITEKPDWMSWEEIHQLLWKAHEQNRKNGINMALHAMPGDKIKEFLEGRGKMFVARVNDKVVGTGALLIKKSTKWYICGKCAYLCFGAVLPEYCGKGIHKEIHVMMEKEALANVLEVVMFDTHENNLKMLETHKMNGFWAVDVRACKDHYNVVMAKWFNGSPYPQWYIKLRFLLSKFKQKTRYKMVPGKGRIKRFGI